MPRPRSTEPTQADIARDAGVSVPTVSKALRADPSISARTRTAVLASARRLGYRTPSRIPPESAGRVDQVAVVFDTVDTHYAAKVLRGILEEAELDGVGVRIAHLGQSTATLTEADTARCEGLVLELLTAEPLGLVLVTTGTTERILQTTTERGIPLVVVDPAAEVPAGTSSICSTNQRGGRQAVEHLCSLGHRRIGLIAGPRDSAPARERLAGYTAALAQAQIDADPSIIRHGLFSYDTGLSLGRELLTRPQAPTAIVASCDTVAAGVIEAARRLGMSVPQDLSVVGFDDTETASICSPPLTTVQQPLVDMGAQAMRTVIRRARLKAARALAPIELTTTLVVRGSTAPPRRTGQ